MTAADKVWPAPAKLNLFLHVTGRRADGYHLLQTVFQFLDFGDDLRFTPRRDGAIRRITPVAGVPYADDLAVRAALALKARTGARAGCDIRLDKRIPLGGGLGGGSSDAATTLVALNQAWALRLSTDALAEIGAELGADVPVFVRGFAAWAEGVGERLTPISLPEPWYLVVTPPCAVSTKDIFQAPELPRATPPITPADFAAGRVGNDLAGVVQSRFPPVREALEFLARFGQARMSGSGASVFVDFGEQKAALAARQQLPPGWRSFVARGLNRSPLQVARDDAGTAK